MGAASRSERDPAYEFFEIPVLARVVSRKMHQTTGNFDLNLPLTGAAVIEDRSGGASGNHELIFTFLDPLLSVGNVTITGCGQVMQSAIATDPTKFVVDLTNVCNAQYVTVNLFNVTAFTGLLGDFSATIGILMADTNGDAAVNSADIGQTKSQSGIPLTTANFRADLNIDGTINSAEISLVKSSSGTSISAPPQPAPMVTR